MMYADVLKEMQNWMNHGGQFLELQKDKNSELWIAMVKDTTGVYYGYTIGEENSAFVLALLNYVAQNQYQLRISY